MFSEHHPPAPPLSQRILTASIADVLRCRESCRSFSLPLCGVCDGAELLGVIPLPGAIFQLQELTVCSGRESQLAGQVVLPVNLTLREGRCTRSATAELIVPVSGRISLMPGRAPMLWPDVQLHAQRGCVRGGRLEFTADLCVTLYVLYPSPCALPCESPPCRESSCHPYFSLPIYPPGSIML